MRSVYIKLVSIFVISYIGILAYSNTFPCSFQFDDFRFIVHNPAIRDLYNLQNIWHYFHGRFVTFFSLALNYHFNGLNVFGFHLFNLAVHLVAAILVWWLTLLTLSTAAMKENEIAQHADLIALLTGLVFVSHPLQTEAVTYIWQRAASMAALFYLASLCLYVKSRRMGCPNIYYIFSLIFAVVAMFTKENVVTLPVMILLYEFTFLRTKESFDWKCVTPFMLTIFIVPITFLFIGSQTFQGMHGDLNTAGGVITPMHYFLTQFRALITYVRLVFLPVNQSIDHDYPIFKSIFELPVLIGFLFLITIFYLAKRLFLKYRLVSFSIFWFFLTLIIPESSFWAMGDIISEHRLYLPMVGYSMFLVSGLFYLLGKNNIKIMIITLSLIITCYAFLTYQRNKVWKDALTLWGDAAQGSPHKARPYNNRGDIYFKHGNFSQAISDFTKAIEINPGYAKAYYNRAAACYMQGNFSQAISDFTRAIEINPNYTRAYYNRAVVYNMQGHLLEALSDFTKAIKISPGFAMAYYNQAITYYQLKQYDQSWTDVYKVEELGYAVKPGFINALKSASTKQ